MIEKKGAEVERLVMSIAEASVALNVSRATAYMLVNTGRLHAVRISPRRIVIPVAALMAMLEAGVSKEVSNAD